MFCHNWENYNLQVSENTLITQPPGMRNIHFGGASCFMCKWCRITKVRHSVYIIRFARAVTWPPLPVPDRSYHKHNFMRINSWYLAFDRGGIGEVTLWGFMARAKRTSPEMRRQALQCWFTKYLCTAESCVRRDHLGLPWYKMCLCR